jgi:small conductance mechanosensitive channel
MRKPAFAILSALALAACDKPQSSASAPPAPPPTVQVPLAAKPIEPPPAPQPSPGAQLATRIKALLRGAKDMDAQGVDVTVADGVVTLHGTVPEAEESRNIAGFVSQMDGVRSVVNNLVISRGS